MLSRGNGCRRARGGLGGGGLGTVGKGAVGEAQTRGLHEFTKLAWFGLRDSPMSASVKVGKLETVSPTFTEFVRLPEFRNTVISSCINPIGLDHSPEITTRLLYSRISTLL